MPDDSAHQFVDANILVYAHDISAGARNEKARELIRRLWENKTGCLSIQVLQEFYVVVTQKVSNPISSTDASRIISDLSHWRIHEPAFEDLLSAIDLQQRYSLSFWDAMVVHSAARLRCQVIWSEDMSHGQVYEGIRLINPFLSRVENSEVNR